MPMIRRMSRLIRLRTAMARRLPATAKELLRAILPGRLIRWSPQTRTVRLRMPIPPVQLGPVVRPAAAPRLVTLTAAYHSHIPSVVEQHGVAGYEPETMAAFLAAISFLKAGDVLDIGANVGLFSIVGAATTTATITGFEPRPPWPRRSGPHAPRRFSSQLGPTPRTRCGKGSGPRPEQSRSRSTALMTGSLVPAPGRASSR